MVITVSKLQYTEDVTWFGGTITGNGGTMVSVINSQIQFATLTGCYLKFFGGDGKFYFNKFINITSTAAFFNARYDTTRNNRFLL